MREQVNAVGEPFQFGLIWVACQIWTTFPTFIKGI